MRKLIAIGNVLMQDDGAAIAVARILEPELKKLGIELIYGETDLSYCVSCIEKEDYLILLDAAVTGKQPGEVSTLPLKAASNKKGIPTQHGMRLAEMILLFYPEAEGIIIAIEAARVGFGYQLSPELSGRIKNIAGEVFGIIRNIAV